MKGRLATWCALQTGVRQSSALGALAVMVLLFSACTTAAPPPGSGSLPPTPASESPAPKDVLGAADWSSMTLPASSCDPAASGDITLVDGQGKVTVNPQTSYSVQAVLPPDIGELAGAPAAVLRYSCLLDGANGVGAFPLAVFTAGATAPELLEILHTDDLGITPSGSLLAPDAVSFVDGQLLITGKYLTDTDARCCASGTAWTSIAYVYGRLIPTGILSTNEPPTTLPVRGAQIRGDLIIYDPAVPVHERADLAYLEGTPNDFRDFIWSQKLGNDGPGSDSVISVNRVRLSGFARGSVGYVPPMGGAALLWIKQAGAWQLLTGLQNTPGCAMLQKAGFPADVLGDNPTCLDDSYAEVPYQG